MDPVLSLAGDFCNSYFELLSGDNLPELQSFYKSGASLSRAAVNEGVARQSKDILGELTAINKEVKGQQIIVVSLDATQLASSAIVITVVANLKKSQATFVQTLVLEGETDEEGATGWFISNDLLRWLPKTIVAASAAPAKQDQMKTIPPSAPVEEKPKAASKPVAHVTATATLPDGSVSTQAAPEVSTTQASSQQPKQEKKAQAPREHGENKNKQSAAKKQSAAPVKAAEPPKPKSWADVAAVTDASATSSAPVAEKKPVAKPAVATTKAPVPAAAAPSAESSNEVGAFIRYPTTASVDDLTKAFSQHGSIVRTDSKREGSAIIYFSVPAEEHESFLVKLQGAGVTVADSPVTITKANKPTGPRPDRRGNNSSGSSHPRQGSSGAKASPGNRPPRTSSPANK